MGTIATADKWYRNVVGRVSCKFHSNQIHEQVLLVARALHLQSNLSSKRGWNKTYNVHARTHAHALLFSLFLLSHSTTLTHISFFLGSVPFYRGWIAILPTPASATNLSFCLPVFL